MIPFDKLIDEVEEYFSIKEFVSKKVYKKYGRASWMFFDQRLLENILFIRKRIDKSITINNWSFGGKNHQRGLRENLSKIVKKKSKKNIIYISAHILGKAVDFDVKGMNSFEVRQMIEMFIDELPHPIRFERGVTWVHMDVEEVLGNNDKIIYFNG